MEKNFDALYKSVEPVFKKYGVDFSKIEMKHFIQDLLSTLSLYFYSHPRAKIKFTHFIMSKKNLIHNMLYIDVDQRKVKNMEYLREYVESDRAKTDDLNDLVNTYCKGITESKTLSRKVK